jgi:very-short-patch-repair endonuclease
MSKSHLQDKFIVAWKEHGPTGYKLDAEHTFAAPRRWKFDFAILSHKIAIELEGMAGRHQSNKGFRLDCEKYNEATARGWRLLRFVRDDLGLAKLPDTITTIERTIEEVEQLLVRFTEFQKGLHDAEPRQPARQ